MYLSTLKYLIPTFIIIVVIITLYYSSRNPEIVPIVKVPDIKDEAKADTSKAEIIGKSTQDRNIESYNYVPHKTMQDNNQKAILFVGGMHGGYELNSVILAYQFIDYLNLNKDFIPGNVKISIIPNLNPDGVYKIIKSDKVPTQADLDKIQNNDNSAGRFNANEVDLNRNFDCNWEAKSNWKGKVVNAGTAPFSESEAKALRDYVRKIKPDAVIFWHSAASAVYASECDDKMATDTLKIMNLYAKASDYKAVQSFDAYKITGDSEGWLATIGIPAITVELGTHDKVEWDKNISGVKAILDYYKSK